MDPLQPTAPDERIEAMDALRGFALLGVLLVNMLFFAQPMDLHFLRPLPEHPSRWTFGILLWLAQGKFYGLFSFLFGLGFAVQIARLRDRGEDAPRRFRRRLWALLGIGLAHGLLVWPGDILAIYAVMGFLLLRFEGRTEAALRRWILVLLGLGAAFALVSGLFLLLQAHDNPAQAAQAAREQVREAEASIRAALQAYGRGPFPVLLRQRIQDLAQNYALTLGVSPHLLALFLLGLLSHRAGLHRGGQESAARLRPVAAWGLGLGLPLNLLYTLLMTRGLAGAANPWGMVAFAAYLPGATLLSLGYAAALVLLLQRPAGAWLRALAWPGRMALTCYLGHSLVFTLVFNAYGFGLYGRVGLGPALLMALGLWLALIPACRAWLSRYRMGPAEWAWRRLTYGTAPAFRL